MEFNYDYSIASAAILLILIVYFYLVPKVWTLSNKFFGSFLVLNFLACSIDVINGVIFQIKFADDVVINVIGQLIYFSAQHMVPPIYLAYMFVLTGTMDKNKKMCHLSFIPGFVAQIVVLSSPITGWAFTYTAEDGYQRGPYMMCLVGIAVFYIIASTVEIQKNGRSLGIRYQIASCSFLILSGMCVLIQMIFPKYVLLGAGSAMSCLIMQLTLQNPQIIKEANEKEIQARKAAEEANEAKSSFLANVSHELRTPMNAICGMSEILSKRELNPLEREYVKTIRESSKTMMSIIDDVLDLSKIDKGELSLEEEEYDFYELLKNVEDITATKLQNKPIRFEINIVGNIPVKLRGDKEKLYHILNNILENAVKFTEKGKILLDISFKYSVYNSVNMEFKVTDTGIGIKDEDKEKLFNSFRQIDGLRNRKQGGTGLGLVLAKKFAELMDGDIEFTSEYGSGSCFTIRVKQKCIESVNIKDSLKESGYKIYVFEENNDVRWNLTNLLTQLGVSAVMINDESELQIIKMRAGNPNKTVLFYSGQKYYNIIKNLNFDIRAVAIIDYLYVPGEGQGFDEFIRKPIDIISIKKLLENSKGKRRKRAKATAFKVDKVRIAIVDDNKVNLRVAATLLREFGVVPEAFTSGADILKALTMGREYDMIFMDHMMPEMDGVETTKKIRDMSGKYYKSVPIVALTANAVEGVEKEYLEAGMNDWLFKPVNMEQFEQKLNKFLPDEKKIKHESPDSADGGQV